MVPRGGRFHPVGTQLSVDTHDYPGGAAQPTVSELADNAAELADNAAELRPMMASVTVSLVEAAALTTP